MFCSNSAEFIMTRFYFILVFIICMIPQQLLSYIQVLPQSNFLGESLEKNFGQMGARVGEGIREGMQASYRARERELEHQYYLKELKAQEEMIESQREWERKQAERREEQRVHELQRKLEEEAQHCTRQWWIFITILILAAIMAAILFIIGFISYFTIERLFFGRLCRCLLIILGKFITIPLLLNGMTSNSFAVKIFCILGSILIIFSLRESIRVAFITIRFGRKLKIKFDRGWGGND